MDEGATDGVINNPKSIARPRVSSHERSYNRRCERTGEPHPYMDEQYLVKIYLLFMNVKPPR